MADRDIAAARWLAARFLSQGFVAYWTNRGEEVLRLAPRLAMAVIDVALLDLPGAEVAARLSRDEPGLPIVMTTGDFSAEVEIRARQAGIAHYAHKPLGDRGLEAILAKAREGARR